MNDYFYVPTMDEFHIGFRYQDYCVDSAMWDDAVFKASGFTDLSARNNLLLKDRLHEDLHYSEIRVRKLSTADVEELGWVRIKEDDRAEHIAFKWLKLGKYS